MHRRATNASHWQLVSRKAFYLAVNCGTISGMDWVWDYWISDANNGFAEAIELRKVARHILLVSVAMAKKHA